MKKRVLAIFLASIMAVGMIAGCGKKDEKTAGTNETTTKESENEGEKIEGGSIVRAMPSDISSLNIIYETGDEGATMLQPVYDPLYIVSKDEVRYYLAESRTIIRTITGRSRSSTEECLAPSS